MTRDRRQCGTTGEELAAAFLRARGHEILARNYRCARGEIDLITLAGDLLIFCEVRTRRTRSAGGPLESVTPAKQRQVLRVAEIFLSRHHLHAHPVRFDVVGVEIRGATVAIEHVADAFRGD
jgi:putative endonuclease